MSETNQVLAGVPSLHRRARVTASLHARVRRLWQTVPLKIIGGPFGFRVGRLNLYLWAGSLSKPVSFKCGHCYNLFFGPFGIELVKSQEGAK